MTTTSTLSGRDRAILRAVAAGGAELSWAPSPTCSSTAGAAATSPPRTSSSARASSPRPTLGLVGQRVAAALTPAGRRALGTAPLAA